MNDLGKKGESVAAAYLQQHGYQILHQNYRRGRAEIDIIAQQHNTLVFAEVKARSSNYFGFPEEAVSQRKQELFIETADAYAHEHQWPHEIRFDIIALTQSGSGFKVHHIPDAFH